MSVYTNNVVSGAFRGFGVTQSCFATEMNINLLAEMVGIDPWESGYTYIYSACLDALKDVYYSGGPYVGHSLRLQKLRHRHGQAGYRPGAAVRGAGQGAHPHLRLLHGPGIGQMCLTEICHVTDLSPNALSLKTPTPCAPPDSGTSTASRQTVMTGEAARRAGEKLRLALDEGKSLEELEGREFYGEFSAITDPLGAIKENPISHISYSYGAQAIVLNEEGKIVKAVSAFDVGTPVNIQSWKGQIEGGMLMGIGYGVTEKFECVDGYPKSKFGTIGFMAGYRGSRAGGHPMPSRLRRTSCPTLWAPRAAASCA